MKIEFISTIIGLLYVRENNSTPVTNKLYAGKIILQIILMNGCCNWLFEMYIDV